MSVDGEFRKLNDLRVVDLRSELEKRGLDKTGNKQALLERLQGAIELQGLDPNSFHFTLERKPVKRPSVSSKEEESTHKDATADEGDDNEMGDSLENKEFKITIEEHDIESLVDVKDIKIEMKTTQESNDSDTKDDGTSGEQVIPIHFTLEEEESFQDEEVDSMPIPDPQPITKKDDSRDLKSTANKNQEHSTVALRPVSEEKLLKVDGIASSLGASNTPIIISKPVPKTKSSTQNRNLWITNISKTTRAAELKQALSPYGKVIGAKVVINAKHPGASCYGYVTMNTIEDANNCIVKLNNTELNGQIIHIERIRPDHMSALKFNTRGKLHNKDEKGISKSRSVSKPMERKEVEKRKEEDPKERDKDKRDDREDKRRDKSKNLEIPGARRYEVKRKSRSRERINLREPERYRDLKRSRSRHDDLLTFDKIKEERERQRLREKERMIREETRRRYEEDLRQREVERRQRSEAARLEREREKLRLERDKLEREKAEMIKLERERQKMEREKLEIEKIELRRAKMRLQEEDRVAKRSAPFRRDSPYEDRKRVTTDRRYMDSPPHFDPNNIKLREPTPPSKKFGSNPKEYKSRVGYDKRDSYPSKREREYEAERSHPQTSLPRGPPATVNKYDPASVFNLGRERDIRDVRSRDNSSGANSRLSKDTRYVERDRDRSPHYHSVRDERDRRGIPDHKNDMRSAREQRYGEPVKDSQRFERNTGNTWNHPSAASGKVFNSGSSGPPPKTWAKDSWRPSESSNSVDRWNSNSVTRGTSSLSTTAFSNNSNMNLGPSCPPPPSINNYAAERFEYKSISNLRKY